MTDTAQVWDLSSGRTLAELKGHQKEVRCVAWRPDGRVIATGSGNRTIKLWGPDGAAYKGIEGINDQATSLTFSKDSRTLIGTWGGLGLGYGAAIFDMGTLKERVRFDKHTNSVYCSSFSPDGSLVATCGGGDEIHIWKVADATPVHRLRRQGAVRLERTAWRPNGGAIAWGNTDRREIASGGAILSNAPSGWPTSPLLPHR